MEEKKSKIIKICKILRVFAIIEKIAMIVVVCASFAEMLVVIFNPKKILGMNVNSEFYELSGYSNSLKILFFSMLIIQAVLMIIAMRFAIKLFDNIIEDGVPFKQENAVLIKKIAIVSFILCLLPVVSSDESLLNSNILGGGKNIIFALLFYGVAKVFEYGCILQKDVDETL